MSQHPSRTLERVAEMLQPNDKERFLILVSRFRNIPHDDEYLLVLEAIGFMTMLWSSVPKEIVKVLEGAKPVAESSASLCSMIREAVGESIPSNQDLRAVANMLREHEVAIRAALANAKPPTKQHLLMAPVMLLTVVALYLIGLASGLLENF